MAPISRVRAIYKSEGPNRGIHSNYFDCIDRVQYPQAVVFDLIPSPYNW